ncbi:EAL and HDOD domain-containing protein [Burkholderia plantarii]|uniref:EAL and HDOD domain-containing protein n=1 Tax=Burkholderia plantarii TaxID=41899 RepID=UPI0018DBAB9B|nr:EAL domain-containing protein [Burkholderia plantarii]MBI0328470.1 EAL domain-containing protein [Burkholderia plantarii]
MHDIGSRTVSDLAIFAKQAIVEFNGRLFGHELLFRDRSGLVAAVDDDESATMAVLEAAIGHVGLHQVSPVGSFFINCSSEFLMSSIVNALPPHRFVLEILETCKLDRPLIRRCLQLKEAGFRLALDDVRELSPDVVNILPLIDIVKIDWPFIAPERRGWMIDTVIGHGALALAEKIETDADRNHAVDSGCSLLQGFYFSRPQIISTKKLPADFEVIAQVLQSIIDEESLSVLSNKIERSPELCVELIRIANNCTATNRSRARISSISHAIALAGTNTLMSWCALLLYRRDLEPMFDPLTDLARSRADQIGEALAAFGATARQLSKGRLVGLLSLLHIGRDVTAADFWRPISFDHEIKRALTVQEGWYGELLLAVTAFERPFSWGQPSSGQPGKPARGQPATRSESRPTPALERQGTP